MPRHPAGAPRTAWGSRLLSGLLTLCLAILLPAAPAFAQQKGDPLTELREQIAALTKVDAAAETPPEIRSMNRRFLDQRRAQLLGALKYKAETMRNYLSGVGAHLSAAERKTVEQALAEVEREASAVETGLGGGAPAPAAATVDTAATPPSHASEPKPQAAAAEPAPAPAASAAAPATAARTPAQPAAAVQADCYFDAPPLLVNHAEAAARLFVRQGDAGLLLTQINPLVFLTVADAVSDNAADLSDEERSFINEITFLRAKEETRRTDKQVGASARAEGSTSAAEKPGFTELLGFAVENGAVQQAVSGTTLTLSSSPYMLFRFGQVDDSVAYQNYGYLSRLGVSATFNIGDENDPLLSARRQQLSEWSAKLRLSADRSARSRSAQQIWDTRIRDRFSRAAAVFHPGLADIFDESRERAAIERRMQDSFRSPDFRETLVAARQDPNASDDQKRERVTRLILCQARTAIYEPTKSGALPISAELSRKIVAQTLPQLAEAYKARDEAITEFKNELKALSERPALTLAYTNKREAAGSDYSNLRMLFSKKTTEGMSVVANGGLSFYHRPDGALNQQRVRDIAATLSFEGTAGRSPFLLEGEDENPITFAFTGRYQRMFENRGVAGKKADIAVAQFKVEVPVFMGMSLPFSVTYANATELVKEDHVRANFGFTLDMDKLKQALLLGALRRAR